MKNRRGRTKFAIFLCFVAIVLVLALFGDHFVLNDPYKPDLSRVFLAPCAEYPFGTDNLGRCVLSRILAGASLSIFSALVVVSVVFVFGMTLGVMAGYFGGIFDAVLFRITTIFQAFPAFLLAVAVAGMLGPGIVNGMIALSVVYWTAYARLGKSLVLGIKNENYIKAAMICGAKNRHIILKYIFPNVVSAVIVMAALDISSIIISMASLSFLGLGAQPPTVEWGAMMNEAGNFLQMAPWGLIFPGIALFIVVAVFNMFGDALRERLNAKESGY